MGASLWLNEAFKIGQSIVKEELTPVLAERKSSVELTTLIELQKFLVKIGIYLFCIYPTLYLI
jgi:hypothetical protein